MPVLQKLTDGLRVPVLIWTDDVDSKSIDQLRNVAKLPFVFHHVAAMPDVHAGMGATIGSVIATKGAIIPAAVGVDVLPRVLRHYGGVRCGGSGRVREIYFRRRDGARDQAAQRTVLCRKAREEAYDERGGGCG